MNILVYQHNRTFVVSTFEQGEFDYVDTLSESEKTKSYSHIGARMILPELAASYPSPRKGVDASRCGSDPGAH